MDRCEIRNGQGKTATATVSALKDSLLAPLVAATNVATMGADVVNYGSMAAHNFYNGTGDSYIPASPLMPGYGTQYQLPMSVSNLIDGGYLTRVPASH